MRLLLVVIFIVILGSSLGIAHTWREFSDIEERMELPATVVVGDQKPNANEVAPTTTQRPADISDTAGTPHAEVVGESRHDFGVMRRYAESTHSFVVRNAGNADLSVEREKVSCTACVHTAFEKATVKPGEELEISVTLTTRKPGPELNEALEVRTNDKAHRILRFDLIAYISEAAGASVSELALGTISTEEGGTASFNVYGFSEEPLEILDCMLADSPNRDFFEWEVSDLTPEAVKAGQTHAIHGKEFKVKIKPGLPVGPVEQYFTIRAHVGKDVQVSVPVSGRVTGQISLIGGSTFSPERSRLSLGRVYSREGGSAKLHLMVRGENQDDLQVTVGECDPAEYLSATIGERKAIQDGKAYLYPVIVKLAQNAPSMNRLGGVNAPEGKIVLHTTHPTAKEMTLYVRFAVE